MILTPFRIGWLLVSAACYLILAYAVPRQQFGWLIGLLAVLFGGYAWVLRKEGKRKEEGGESDGEGWSGLDYFLFASAVMFRLLLLVAMPQLSDDVYRFIWDGRLLVHGYNPYLYLPSQLLNSLIATEAGLDRHLFQQLNSPNYFTVYPPLNQALFGVAAALSSDNLLGNIIGLRLIILLSEIGSLWLMTKLLRRFGMNANLALLYGLNPLVILELTGNVHFEAVMIFFVLLAVWWLIQGRWILSAGALALAITTKLLPLLFMPLAIRYLGWRRGLSYAIVTGGMTVALFLPFASLALIQNVFSSINLYFQKFEFNASIYYVLRTIGYWIKGYNTIERVGLGLSIATTFGVLWIAFRDWQRGEKGIGQRVLFTLTLYFLLATTVHPWYVTSLVAASVFTSFRYPVVWSALVPLSYATYRSLPYEENLWLTALEYGVMLVVGIVEGVNYRHNQEVLALHHSQ